MLPIVFGKTLRDRLAPNGLFRRALPEAAGDLVAVGKVLLGHFPAKFAAFVESAEHSSQLLLHRVQLSRGEHLRRHDVADMASVADQRPLSFACHRAPAFGTCLRTGSRKGAFLLHGTCSVRLLPTDLFLVLGEADQLPR